MLLTMLLVAGLQAERTEIDRTERFVFTSDRLLNVHDELNRASRTEPAPEPECFAGLPDEARRGHAAALAFYRAEMSVLSTLSPTMAAVRAARLGVSPPASADHALVEAALRHVEAAAPAYTACLWEDQDRVNRAWIADVVPRVRRHEREMSERLAAALQHDWPDRPIPIDVAGWVSHSGANSLDVPVHVMISSRDPSYRGDAGLEMVFHEAAHLLLDAQVGRVAEAIGRANAGRMLPRRDLWHTILFYTVGELMKDRLAASGREGYVPYLYANGLIDRGWRPYREPLETHWRRYLDGELTLDVAVDRLLAAIHAP